MLAVRQRSDDFKTVRAVESEKSNTSLGAFAFLISGKGSYQEEGPWSGIRGEGIDWHLDLGPFHMSQPVPAPCQILSISYQALHQRRAAPHSCGVTLELGECYVRTLLSNLQ